MTSVGFLFVSLFIELGFEVVIDVMALQVEGQEGIDMTEFWNMWRGSQSYIQAVCGESSTNIQNSRDSTDPYAFTGLFLSDAVYNLYTYGFVAFMCTPTPIFCTEPDDPCACTGGGFEIYGPFCDRAKGNSTNVTDIAEQAKNSYVAVPGFVTDNMATFAATIGTVIAVVVSTVVEKKICRARRVLRLTRDPILYILSLGHFYGLSHSAKAVGGRGQSHRHGQ